MDDLESVAKALEEIFSDDLGAQSDEFWMEKAENLISELEERGVIIA